MTPPPWPVAALLAVFLFPVPSSRAADPDILWKIVHGRCVPDQQANHRPAPCASVDLDQGEAGGYAVLKDRNGASQYLLIPTRRIAGIESPLLLAPGAPNYFAAAWAATGLVGARLHRALPRQDLSLAVNSVTGRTQDQLHIHVDCIAPDVRAALDRAEPDIGSRWQPLPTTLAGHRYRAIRLAGPELGEADPFRVLAQALQDPAGTMGRHTLVLVGDVHDGAPDFILLDGQSRALAWLLAPLIKLGSGSGEELQDHGCRIAGAP